MIFRNDSHVYLIIKERVKADYAAPYEDGSMMESKFMQRQLKEDECVFNYLNDYIQSGRRVEVSRVEFPCRHNNYLDSLKLTQATVWDDIDCRSYSFYIGSPDENISNHREYYIVDWIIE